MLLWDEKKDLFTSLDWSFHMAAGVKHGWEVIDQILSIIICKSWQMLLNVVYIFITFHG